MKEAKYLKVKWWAGFSIYMVVGLMMAIVIKLIGSEDMVFSTIFSVVAFALFPLFYLAFHGTPRGY